MKDNFPKLPLFLSIILLIFSCALFVFLYTKIKNNNEISQQLSTQWQTEAKLRDDMKTLERSLKAIDKERTLLQTHFAQSSDVVPFLNMIEKLAKSVGATAEVLVVKVLQDAPGLAVEIKALGSFASVYKFLTLLENSPYELEFTSIDMQKPDTLDANGKIKTSQWSATLQVKLLTFMQ
jgi:hypothetical protein